MKRDQSVSVIICTKDRPTECQRLLNALSKQTLLPTEIIVVENVDNGASLSAKKIKTLFNKPPKVIYIPITRSPIGGSRDIGLKKATGEIVIYIDDDIIPPPDLVRRLRTLHYKHPLALGFTGLILPLQKDAFSEFTYHYFNHRYTHATKLTSIPYFGFSTLSLKKSLLKKENARFNSSLKGGEDTLFLRELTKKGYKLYFSPQISVQHDYLRNNFLTFFKRFWSYGKTILIVHALDPDLYLDFHDYFPRKKWHLYFLPFFMIRRVFQLTSTLMRNEQYPQRLFIPTFLYFGTTMLSLYTSPAYWEKWLHV